MYAVQISKFGTPEDVVALVEIPEPAPPSPGEVTVQLEYAPIHPADIMLIRGIYGKLPKLPSTLGMEGVGRVVAIGEGVDSLGIGDRVFTPIFTPCWCERLTIPAAGLFPAPDDADLPQLSMSRINPLTAHLLLTEFAPLQAGDWVIQNAANSAAGRAVIALAKARGLRTVNVVRREGLDDELTGLGGDVVLLDGADLASRVAATTNGARVALGIDAVAGDATLAMSTCIAGRRCSGQLRRNEPEAQCCFATAGHFQRCNHPWVLARSLACQNGVGAGRGAGKGDGGTRLKRCPACAHRDDLPAHVAKGRRCQRDDQQR